MRRYTLTLLATGTLFLAGCVQSDPAPLNEKECVDLHNKMKRTDSFIRTVSQSDPAHVEEMLAAVPRSEITTAMTKPKMLKDARKRMEKLQSEWKASGCKPIAK